MQFLARTRFASVLAGLAFVAIQSQALAVIVISEVHPSGSSNSTYLADWFELTNTGAAAVDITGWKIDDSSNAFATAFALRGVTSILPGQSVVFAEGNAAGSNDATIQAAFKTAWFGGSIPAGFTIGGYGGSGLGLSSGGDGVNIFDSIGTPIASVSFSAATAGVTFDNAAGLAGPISALSAVGVNGAFNSLTGGEIGSPGVVPEPATLGLLGLGCLAMIRRRRAN